MSSCVAQRCSAGRCNTSRGLPDQPPLGKTPSQFFPVANNAGDADCVMAVKIVTSVKRCG